MRAILFPPASSSVSCSWRQRQSHLLPTITSCVGPLSAKGSTADAIRGSCRGEKPLPLGEHHEEKEVSTCPRWGHAGGDLNPVIGLALELVRRGHGITIASNGSHKEKTERLGLDYLPLRPAMDQDQLQTWMGHAIQSSIEGNRYMVRELVLPHVEWNYHQLEKTAPDYDVLLCHTLAYSVPLVAKKLGKPWVSFVISPLVYHAEYGRRRIIGRGASRDFLWRIPLPAFVAKAIGSLGKKIVDPWVAPLKKLRESLDLPDLGDVHILEESQNSPHLNLAFFSSLFAPAREGWPRPMCQTGFVFHQQEEESLSRETREFLDEGDPPLLFSLGTSGSGTEGQRFCEVAAEASLLMDKRAVLVTGSNTEILQNIPRDDRLLPIAYEPFSQLVPSGQDTRTYRGSRHHCLRSARR